MRALGSGVLAIVSLVALGCGGGSSSNSPTAPSGSGGTSAVTGGWTGTITRPGGLGTLSLRWEAATDPAVDYRIAGPMTLTNGGTSVTVPAQGNTAGNDRNGYSIHMSFNSELGSTSPDPAVCTVRGNSAPVRQEGDPFPQPYRTISVPTFQISYSGCRGLVDTGYSSPQSNFLQENVQLSLQKQ
jgi:hypothetical protein